jgi:hypothetical protein
MVLVLIYDKMKSVGVQVSFKHRFFLSDDVGLMMGSLFYEL